MRRIAYILVGLALVGATTWSCSSDAPAPTPPGGAGGPTGTGALQIRLFTSNANPVAGSCTLIEAVVTLNGANVPDGTGVSFTTDLPGSFFSQNALSVISVVTQGGTATTALCSSSVGLATVRASATVGSNTGSATISIAFQASPQSAPFITFCSPSFGPSTGGTALTINGGRFTGTPATTRVTFNAASVSREALVTGVTATSVTVVTPAFPEATSPSVPVNITLTFGTNTATPVSVSLPNCFAFGTTAASNPKITAVLPSSGSNEGNTRVTIIGSGFVLPVQVFFGPAEAQVLSVSFNQIIALTPPASGAGLPNLNKTVDVRVHEVNSGLDDTLTGGFRFVVPLQLTAIDNSEQEAPFTPVTIHGQGFLAPVAVSLAGIPATVISVSATELLVLPGPLSTCGNKSGAVVVTNIDSGDTQSGLTFTYLCTPTPTPTPTPTLIPPTATPTPTPTATPTRTPVPPDVELAKGGSPPNPVAPDSVLTFTLTVTNKGSVPVTNAVVNDPLPGGTTFLTCTPSQGTCNGPTVGTNGTVTANLGSIGAPGVALVTITVRVPVSAAGTSFVNTAVVTSSPQDPIPSHSIATYSVTVGP
ncbi:MAG TPA: IPT/TIG domain-containing protein [Thermoanaerobaculia bacterium]|nr:IPT/TIG domain-containing protein [Thermoanaerobaculia bacterium]